MPAPQGKFFLLTIPAANWNPPNALPEWASYMVGQKEEAPTTGFIHWQLVVALTKKSTITGCKHHFCAQAHVELSRSAAANDYVQKEETAVAGTRFSLGALPMKLNSKIDWDLQWQLAKEGKIEEMSKGVLVRSYNTIKKIKLDHMNPIYRGQQKAFLFWGPTGTGKSRAAKSIYPQAFRKNGENKWWDTYTDQQEIVVEEFRGQLPVSLLLKYLDRESLLVETKFGGAYLNSKKWVFTSNVPIHRWYPDLDADTIAAIERRFVVHHLTDLQGTQQWVEGMGKEWVTDEEEINLQEF